MKAYCYFIFILFLLFPAMAMAEFSAVFQSDPLFDEANIMPGDGFDKYFKVHNSDSYKRQVFVRAENYDDGLLAGGLDLLITDHDSGAEIYRGSLADFLTGDWLEMPELPAGAEQRYDLSVDFPIESGNEFQNTGVEFDLVLKSESDKSACICHYNCGHKWAWRHWYHWNNVIRSWLQRLSLGWWKMG